MAHDPKHPAFAVTVDVVCLTVRHDRFQILLVRRGGAPYAGAMALPGGFVREDEDLDAAARRELREETAVTAPAYVEQLATYGAPDRDPRGRTVSVAFLAIAPELGEPVGGTDAADAGWYDVSQVLDGGTDLAFDHARIVADGVERARGKLEYYPLALEFCRPEFTIGELRHVYELVWGERLDPANFHRKVTRTDGFLTELDTRTTRGGGRPARLYRGGSVRRLHPPLMREG